MFKLSWSSFPEEVWVHFRPRLLSWICFFTLLPGVLSLWEQKRFYLWTSLLLKLESFINLYLCPCFFLVSPVVSYNITFYILHLIILKRAFCKIGSRIRWFRKNYVGTSQDMTQRIILKAKLLSQLIMKGHS